MDGEVERVLFVRLTWLTSNNLTGGGGMIACLDSKLICYCIDEVIFPLITRKVHI